MPSRLIIAALTASFALVSCGGEKTAGAGPAKRPTSGRAEPSLVKWCESQPGFEGMRQAYGEDYCACSARAAKADMPADDFKMLVAAANDWRKVSDPADRAAVWSRNTKLFYAYAAAAAVCAAPK